MYSDLVNSQLVKEQNRTGINPATKEKIEIAAKQICKI